MNQTRIKRLFTCSIILLMFTGAVCSATQGVLLTNYIDHYGLQSSAQGLMSSMQSAGSLAALLLIGLLAGRLQKTTIVLISAVAIPLIFVLLGSQPAFAFLLIGYLLFGVAFGFQDSLASSLMVDLNPQKSGAYMNILHGVFGLGGIIAPICYAFLLNRGMAWSSILALVACLCGVACLIYVLCRARLNKCYKGEAVPTRRITLADIKQFVSERRKALLLCCAFLFGAHQIGISSWITRYVNEYMGQRAYGALALSLFWVGTAASRLLSSLLPLPRAKKIVGGFLLTSVFIAVGILSQSGLVMAVCCLLAGLAEGPILPLMLDMSCNWERDNTSLGSTILLLAVYIGFLIMPVLIGKLAASFNMSVGLLTSVLASAVGCALSVRLIKLDA